MSGAPLARQAVRILGGIAALALAACATFRSAPNGPTPAWSIHLPGTWAVKTGGEDAAKPAIVTVHPDGTGGFLARAKGRSDQPATRLRVARVAGRDYLICAPLNPAADEPGCALLRVTWMPEAKAIVLEQVATEPLKAAVAAGTIHARLSGLGDILILEAPAGVERLLAEGKVEFVPLGTATRASP